MSVLLQYSIYVVVDEYDNAWCSTDPCSGGNDVIGPFSSKSFFPNVVKFISKGGGILSLFVKFNVMDYLW